MYLLLRLGVLLGRKRHGGITGGFLLLECALLMEDAGCPSEMKSITFYINQWHSNHSFFKSAA